MSSTTQQQVQLSYDILQFTASGLYLSEKICVELLQPVRDDDDDDDDDGDYDDDKNDEDDTDNDTDNDTDDDNDD